MVLFNVTKITLIMSSYRFFKFQLDIFTLYTSDGGFEKGVI